MSWLQLQSAVGLGLLCLLAWALGGFRRGVRARVVLAGLGSMLGGAALLLWLPGMRQVFAAISNSIDVLTRATRQGTSLVFGYLGGGTLPFAETAPGASFILFFQALPLILVVGALSSLLYHWRILPLVVGALARGLRWAFGLSGACNLSVAANVFVGMVEAPLLIRPWLARLSMAELLVVMVAGLATISGNMLVLYAQMIGPYVPDAAGQLLTASLISAPASVLAGLLMLPETHHANAATADDGAAPPLYQSSMDAIMQGTADAVQLMLNIMGSLIVFVALVALVNAALEPLFGLTLQMLAGWLFWPLAWAMGVPAAECARVAELLGIKLVLNEFVSYLQFAQSGGAGLGERSRLILTYALCGFANFGSVGIMVTGMVAMCPERRLDIARLGLPSLWAGSIACCMAGATMGVLSNP